MTAVAGEEDFVTAVLLEFHGDHTATVVNCGRCAPVMLLNSSQQELGSLDAEPPLGLGPHPRAVTVPLL